MKKDYTTDQSQHWNIDYLISQWLHQIIHVREVEGLPIEGQKEARELAIKWIDKQTSFFRGYDPSAHYLDNLSKMVVTSVGKYLGVYQKHIWPNKNDWQGKSKAWLRARLISKPCKGQKPVA